MSLQNAAALTCTRDAARDRRVATGPRRRIDHPGVVGRSEALLAVLDQVAVVASKDVTVLLTGRTGTGKTQLARVIHENSPRRGREFLEVNCAALPEGLFECEFFGALPGAYTGATRRMEGKVARARGGTLFLDEIGELSIRAQSKLLQFLQSKQYSELGGGPPRTADVRVIAAANVDLIRATRENRFREDLLFRIAGMTIRMPSLSERRADIRTLAEYFCEDSCRRHGLGDLHLSQDALVALEFAEWPGNVRELEKVVELGAIRAADAGSAFIEEEDLVRDRLQDVEATPQRSFREQTKRFQRDLLLRALRASNWRVSDTARSLDLTRAHVYGLMNSFEIRNREGVLVEPHQSPSLPGLCEPEDA